MELGKTGKSIWAFIGNIRDFKMKIKRNNIDAKKRQLEAKRRAGKRKAEAAVAAREDALKKRRAAVKRGLKHQKEAETTRIKNNSRKQNLILVTSTQRPYHGGAATNAYALVKYFRSLGIKTAGLFYSPGGPVDPDNIGGVFAHKTTRDSRKDIFSYLKGRPDLIFAKNYAAPAYSRSLYSNSKVIYLASGCPHMMKLSAKDISAVKYLKSSEANSFRQEIRAVEVSDYILPNSEIAKRLIVKHYGNSTKILDPMNTSLATHFSPKKIQFSRRKYDIVFICSNFSRTVKNSKLAREIFERFKDREKLAIGGGSFAFSNIPNTTCLPATEHGKVIDALSNSKLVLSPSYYDASPNIIREAIECGANILVSKNCGWSETYPNELVCEDVYDKEEWFKKVEHLLVKKIRIYGKKDVKSLEDLLNV